jgi:hypothetical protein
LLRYCFQRKLWHLGSAPSIGPNEDMRGVF